MASPEPSDPPPLHPLLTKTYNLHTLTPLHAFPAITRAALQPHARTLASQLRGDLIRGVTTSAADTTEPASTAPNTGKLKTCTWLPLPESTYLPGISGVEITLEYENISYSALLVRWDGGDDEEDGNESAPPPRTTGSARATSHHKQNQQQKKKKKNQSARTKKTEKPGFTHLPLLLARMPKHIKDVVWRYFETTFDAVVRPLLLEERVLRDGLARWIETRGTRRGEVRLVFAARGDKAGVRTMAITVAPRDVGRFGRRGWWRCVHAYLKEVCGVDVGDGVEGLEKGRDGWELQKVICRGFVMQAGEGPGKWKGFEGRGEAEERVLRTILGGVVRAAEV